MSEDSEFLREIKNVNCSILCLDIESIKLTEDIISRRSGLLWFDPFNEALSREDFYEMHRMISKLSRVFAVDENVRGKIQFRFSKPIELVPEFPVIPYRSNLDISNRVLLISSGKHIEEKARELEALLDEFEIFKIEIGNGSYSNELHFPWLFGDAIEARVAIFVGDFDRRVPPLRHLDLVMNRIPVLNVSDGRYSNQVISEGASGCFNIRNLNKGIFTKLVKDIVENDNFRETFSAIQKKGILYKNEIESFYTKFTS